MNYSINQCVKTNAVISEGNWTIPKGEKGIVTSSDVLNFKNIYRVRFERLNLNDILIYEYLLDSCAQS